MSALVGVTVLAALTFLVVGLWMMSTPEPRVQLQGESRPFILRTLALTAAPALGLIVMIGARPAVVPWPPWVVLLLGIIGIVLAGTHAVSYIDQLRSLERRCLEQDEERRALLEKHRQQTLGCAVLVLAVCSLGFFFAGGSTMAGAIVLVWFVAVSLTRGTLKRIRMERMIAMEFASAGDASRA